jgi:hypothetical protein
MMFLTVNGTHMPPRNVDLNVNPSDEPIRLGPLAVRFLITGDDANGSVALFELAVPAAQRLAAPAHSHEGGGRWTTGQSQDGRSHASSWPDPGAVKV